MGAAMAERALLIEAGLLLGLVWRDHRVSIARLATVGVVVYLGAAALGHEAALRRWEAGLSTEGLRPRIVAAIPVLGSPALWKGLAETDASLYEGRLTLLPGIPTEPVRYAKPNGNPFIARAEGLSEVGLYRAFARFLWVRYAQEGIHHIVEFTDLRYGSRMLTHGMVLRVVLDGSGGVRDVHFNHRF